MRAARRAIDKAGGDALLVGRASAFWWVSPISLK
jgi:hypothetical protein